MKVPQTQRLFDEFRDAAAGESDRGQLGVFMVLVFGAVALVVVSIVLLFGMQIAGGFDVTGDPFTVTNESFTQDTAAPFDYQVERHPGTEDVVSLDDSVTVYNTTSGAELTNGTDYEWFPENGTVRITDGSTAGDTYNITYSGREHEYATAADSTTSSTGDAFELFGTSVLVIPAAAVLAVLIGGLVGAISMGGSLPGIGGNNGNNGRRGR